MALYLDINYRIRSVGHIQIIRQKLKDHFRLWRFPASQTLVPSVIK